jgi:N4-gp56 family major capsid protein
MNTTQNIPPAVQETYNRVLLERAVEVNVHRQFAQMKPMASRNGDTMVFRRYESLEPSLVPLQEGITPPASKVTVTTVKATLEQYGNWLPVTDRVTYTVEDAVLVEFAQLNGENMGTTHDLLLREVMNAGSNVLYENGTQSGANRAAVNAVIADATMDLAIETLRSGRASTIKRIIQAAVGISTRPIAASYAGICHTRSMKQLRNLTDWTPYQEYAKQADLMDNEFGSANEVRFCWSNNAKYWTAAEAGQAKAVYATMLLGANFTGTVELGEGTAKNIVKTLGSAGTEDALNQRASSGWKSMTTNVILNDDFGERIEHTLS